MSNRGTSVYRYIVRIVPPLLIIYYTYTIIPISTYLHPIRLNLKYNSSSIMCFAYTIKTGIISGLVYLLLLLLFAVALLIFILKFIVFCCCCCCYYYEEGFFLHSFYILYLYFTFNHLILFYITYQLYFIINGYILLKKFK